MDSLHMPDWNQVWQGYKCFKKYYWLMVRTDIITHTNPIPNKTSAKHGIIGFGDCLGINKLAKQL